MSGLAGGIAGAPREGRQEVGHEGCLGARLGFQVLKVLQIVGKTKSSPKAALIPICCPPTAYSQYKLKFIKSYELGCSKCLTLNHQQAHEDRTIVTIPLPFFF